MSKRIFDIVISLLLMLILFPLIITCLILVKIFLGSPALYISERPGLNEKPFELLKFRSMTGARDEQGNLLSDEERLTAFGRFLRRNSLDELPQLFNVIKGDLSLVGPRPLLTEYLPLYSKEQARRHEVRPGITGWAQVNGRNAIGWDEKFKLDVWYVDNKSFWLDLKIILLTIKKVVVKEGINSAGVETMPKFLGAENEKE